MTENSRPNLSANFYVTLAVVAAGVWWLFRVAPDVIGYFFAAMVIAYLLNPLVDWLEKRRLPKIKRPIGRGAAILAVFAGFGALVALVLALSVPVIVRQVESFAKDVPAYVDAAKETVERAKETWIAKELPTQIPPEAAENAKALAGKLLQGLQSAVKTVGGGIVQGAGRFVSQLMALIIVPILVFYFLSDAPKSKESFLKALPPRFRNETDLVLKRVNGALGAFIRGQVKLCVAMGVLSGLAFWLIGMKYAFIFGVIAGLTEFIPYLGPVLGFIGPVVLSFFMGPTMIVKTLVLFAVIQLLEGNVLAPKIMSGDVGLHPALIMFVMLVAGKVGGIAGMIFAIPAAAVIKVLFVYFYLEKVVHPEEAAESGKG